MREKSEQSSDTSVLYIFPIFIFPFIKLLTPPQQGKVNDLKTALSVRSAIPADDIEVCDIFNKKIYGHLKNDDLLEKIKDNDVMFGYQVATKPDARPLMVSLPIYLLFSDPFKIQVCGTISYFGG